MSDKQDMQVKCTRCRNNHLKSERVDVFDPKAKYFITYNSTCPRCGCKSYYDSTPNFAWCWASGLIEIGDTSPVDDSGAILIATGPKYALEMFLNVVARHGKGASEGKLLVPGVPEAPDGDAAIKALETWLKWCAPHKVAKRDGITLVLGGRVE
ncbi:hypothetical protein OI450_14295 [Pectobacterium cacticida]|uniref:Uncharacterized protein n=1 Tax=Pectobacterium cacticida TaxID=69221 RepID=A0ABZ2GEP1_9GAMM|nr:hypothetical protein [Pectobacterium cacticida]UYX06086.1 hypothetical protein OI450_14295 [Pectobacterium cacticida]